MADRVGQRFGNYELMRLLGKGGFAEVYLGRHVHLSSQAAIKILLNELSDKNKELFFAEGRTLVRLIHPHIVRLLDFGIEKNIPYFAMDYAPHGSLLEKHPQGTRLPLDTIVSYVNQVAAALQYAHDQKLIHRDVKPANMLLNANNEVVLSDFGIAVVAHSAISMSIEDAIGTPHYMAPEQMEGQPRTASDQYALGVITYSWLAGVLPFTGTDREIMSQQLFKRPPAIRNIVPTIPVEVEQVVFKALEKAPERRFESIQAFAQALEQASQKWTMPATNAHVLQQSQLEPGIAAQAQRSQKDWFVQGNKFYHAKQLREAIAAYDQAIKLDAHDISAHNNRGLAYVDLQEYQRAIADYTQAITLNPQYVHAYHNRGNVYASLQEYQRAIADYTQAIALNPPNIAEVYHNRGLAYASLQKYQQAIIDFTQAIALNPHHSVAWYNRGTAYKNLREYRKAIEDFDRALVIDPNYAKAKHNREEAYRLLYNK